MKRIKAWWNKNSRKNQQVKTVPPLPVKCESCGQIKGWKMPESVVVENKYLKMGKVSGTYFNPTIK